MLFPCFRSQGASSKFVTVSLQCHTGVNFWFISTSFATWVLSRLRIRHVFTEIEVKNNGLCYSVKKCIYQKDKMKVVQTDPSLRFCHGISSQSSHRAKRGFRVNRSLGPGSWLSRCWVRISLSLFSHLKNGANNPYLEDGCEVSDNCAEHLAVSCTWPLLINHCVPFLTQ